MTILPLRFREFTPGTFVFSDDTGAFFVSNDDFLERYANDHLDAPDVSFLEDHGQFLDGPDGAARIAATYRLAARQARPGPLSYLILVPTLRCNLSCGYCQVSRAAEGASGYDWTEETLSEVLDLIDGLTVDDPKFEFQGGEPLLRLDLLDRVRDFCRTRFRAPTFVVCTNLHAVDDDAWRFLDQPDTWVSTSLDGDMDTHRRQRTKSLVHTLQFEDNLQKAVQRLGQGKVAALPTIDVENPPDFEELASRFEAMGTTSINFRPINHQGFARRTGSVEDARRWARLHVSFVEFLIERNARTGRILEEFHLAHCLRRVLRPGLDQHMDVRNPSPVGRNYVVIDQEGTLFPTDEARMQARIGRIDLSIGTVRGGFDFEKIATMNGASVNTFDPDCIHCPYQPFCGSDVVDDISRYGRVDLPRRETWFCQRQTAVFDKIFELMQRDDDATRVSIAAWAGVPEWVPGIVPVLA